MKRNIIFLGSGLIAILVLAVVWKGKPQPSTSNSSTESTSTLQSSSSENGSFLSPRVGEVLSLGDNNNLKWDLPLRNSDERYNFEIYLVNQAGMKVSTSSVAYFNYAKNGETSADWKVGYLPTYGTTLGKQIAAPGVYTLLMDYSFIERSDEAHHTFTSSPFEIK